tara:strand:+ start:1270 stop:1647 length:378 start_codon:yes stop_codon:yes gene_type:complete
MKLLVTGGRDFTDQPRIWTALDWFRDKYNVDCLFHGAARGVDTICANWASSRNIHVAEARADWDLYGKKAGIVRNQLMLDWNPDYLIAFPGGRGTGHMVRIAMTRKANTGSPLIWDLRCRDVTGV